MTNNTENQDAPFLDPEEADLINSIGGDILMTPLSPERTQMWQKSAQNTLKKLKKKPITIRLQEIDILDIKAIAYRKGIPYQTLLSSVIHQWAQVNKNQSQMTQDISIDEERLKL